MLASLKKRLDRASITLTTLLAAGLAILLVVPVVLADDVLVTLWGAAIAVLVVALVNRQRTMHMITDVESREKADLILQMGSNDVAFTREAIRKLRARCWLEDGSTIGASLVGANLQGAYLEDAILSHANLSSADLREADLRRTNLQGATLLEADLSRAQL